MLPNTVPVPTLWTEEERILLLGTSLEVRCGAFLLFVARRGKCQLARDGYTLVGRSDALQ
jgi:hypothetical protein